MKIDREQLIKAIKFLKHAILVTDRHEPLGFLHVRIDEGKAILTAADHYVAKRVTLIEPQQIEVDGPAKTDPNGQFMISKATLEAFETLCSKHKQKFRDSSDPSNKIIEISADELVSHKDTIHYEQPAYSYPLEKVDDIFNRPGQPVGKLTIFPDVVLSAFKDFNQKTPLIVSFSGQSGAVYIEQDDYQAAFLPMEINDND